MWKSFIGDTVAGAALVLSAVTFAPSQASAFCVVNEAAVALRVFVNSGSVYVTRPWQITIPPGHRGCCPARKRVCNKPSATVKAFLQGEIVKGNRGPRLKPRIGPWGRIPIAPINPYLGRQTELCRLSVRRSHTVRLFWNRRHRGCEVWSGTKIVSFASVPRSRYPVRRHLVACNRTGVKAIYVTYAAWWGSRRKWTTRGWFKILRNRCMVLVLPHDYRANAYVYAIGGGKKWSTNHASLCVNRKSVFRLALADRTVCPAGLQKAGFIKVTLKPGANQFSFHPL